MMKLMRKVIFDLLLPQRTKRREVYLSTLKMLRG
jgi:hypothetical protein